MKHAVFLDRDGVINKNRPNYVLSWEEFEFLPGALEALNLLNEANIPTFIVTNQACINKGLLTHKELHQIHSRMLKEVELNGGKIEEIVYCPHTDKDNCRCRKPKPGMLRYLLIKYNLCPLDCILIGDSKRDILAAKTLSIPTISINITDGDYYTSNLLEAIKIILGRWK